MALIVCPECGHKISSAAKQCVLCGYPVGAIIKNDLVDRILQEATIEQLNLSVRTYNILRKEGIRTVRDLCQYDEFQIFKFKNMGKKSTEEIISRLFDLGLRLREKNSYAQSPLVKIPATKYDWCCDRAPKNIKVSSFEYAYSPSELEKIKLGFIPSNMDQMFCYYENRTVHFYRSWTGTLVCRVILNESSNKHIVLKYYNEEEEADSLDYLDAQRLIRRVIDGWDL